jgi:hypothetical protein
MGFDAFAYRIVRTIFRSQTSLVYQEYLKSHNIDEKHPKMIPIRTNT